MIQQVEFALPKFPIGFHLITELVVKKLPALPETGMANIFIKHTSAALTINENADYTVRKDFQKFISTLVPFSNTYEHTLEGEDDMTAHIKSSLLGQSVWIPISNGELNLGTWQGIYLCEFRNHGGNRKLVITIIS
ncbi:MAG TPA: secondary thiamine-phosphate synthase enzyme YjbQ [Tenuifilaceae bacterium]|jgi:secondary thiamine-phosphate synthase enzyme|nr:secondary thiamine-phosphate synthase enzyme YjbQ [Bacteroidales bacterium]HNY09088.1 secondary thiamine-phosphate synthase enzyme YjbQ [Tenuifilaceae bacterium]MBP8643445.1 secondary thiamine-phosphate synthase enzyme YjbQ [Bacteroidales bacterium]NLI86755.1 YjbQ family protein [Bacteroidales bacterium]HOA09747.1 secondary thiamine-phosphate synthase enzyme YjbQ [Tenuifilaceae bacterium]